MQITPSGQACGASVSGVDLRQPLSADLVGAIRAAWLQHHVLAFPDQDLTDDDLERFTLAFGGFGDDPFIAPIPGRKHVIAVERLADETSPLFAENWHSDWSFQARPPAGTCLYGIKIPPVEGNHNILYPGNLRRRGQRHWIVKDRSDFSRICYREIGCGHLCHHLQQGFDMGV
jgi:taurine dioxygenase